MQLAVASAIVKQDGFGALYRGLSAGLLRQATYTTARLGIFQGLSDYLKKANDGKARALYLTQPCITGICECGFLSIMLTMTQSHSSRCAHWLPHHPTGRKRKPKACNPEACCLCRLSRSGRRRLQGSQLVGWVHWSGPLQISRSFGCRQTLRCPLPAGETTRAWVTPWLVSLILAHAASTYGQSALLLRMADSANRLSAQNGTAVPGDGTVSCHRNGSVCS